MPLSVSQKQQLKQQFADALDAAAALDDGTVPGARKATDASYQCEVVALRTIEAFRRVEDAKDGD